MQASSSHPGSFTHPPRSLAVVILDDPYDSVAMLLVMACGLLTLVCSVLSFWR